jgi:cytochrome c peroxidase
MSLFYGKAGCAACHTGAFLTDHDFHAIAMPQIGPGKGDGPSRLEDFGHERVTGLQEDRFRFRTPSLRNVALTGPWGHDGAYNTLRAIIEHNIDPIEALLYYDTSQAVLPPREDLDALDFVVQNDPTLTAAIALANEIPPKNLTPDEVDHLIAFLHALTDPASLDLRKDVPLEVPSGLPVAEAPADPWPVP